MFQQARRRLALRYAALFIVILLMFSVAFVIVLAIALQPAFDISPEVSSGEAARVAYARTVERILVAVVVADGVAFIVVATAAYHLAGRTLQPISEAHERQRRFVANASHEMRNPLAAIRATADSAIAGTTPTGQGLAAIAVAVERLTRLTNDLLLLARSERGSIDGSVDKVDLSVVVAEAVSTVCVAREFGSEAIDVSLLPDLLVDVNEHELARIVENLVDNAVLYGAPGGRIRVRTVRRDAWGVVEVSDLGPGIAPADQERIFEPFFRVRTDVTMPHGSGLGLSIAMELARRNGGSLDVTSRPGAGATFALRLPRFR